MKHVYQVAGLSKQAHNQQIKRNTTNNLIEQAIVEEVKYLRKTYDPGTGLRALYERYGSQWAIGRDAFIALGIRNGLMLERPRKLVRTTFSTKQNRYKNELAGKEFTDVNQVWVSDITYFKLGGLMCYITLLMDGYSRRVLGAKVATNMRAENNVDVLKQALACRGIAKFKKGLIHHSDKGSQYIAAEYTNLLDDAEICISMCDNVLENAHCERLNGTVKNDYLRHWSIKTARQLSEALARAVKLYNCRPHQSLGKKSPLEFEQALKTQALDQRKKMTFFAYNKPLSSDFMKLSSDLERFAEEDNKVL